MAKPAREAYSPDRAVDAVLRRLKQPRAAGKTVTATALAKHLDLSQQRITQLADEHIIDRLPDRRFDQDACRIAYLRWLRAPERRMQRNKVDADFIKAKTELIAIRVREKKHELMMTEEALADMEQLIGIVLTEMSSMPALIGGPDLQLRRKVEKCVFDTRVKLANTFTKIADEARGPASTTTDTPDEDDAAA